VLGALLASPSAGTQTISSAQNKYVIPGQHSLQIHQFNLLSTPDADGIIWEIDQFHILNGRKAATSPVM